MESNNARIFLDLVDKISRTTGLNDKEISLRIHRNSGFIAQLKSRIKSNTGEVSNKLIDSLRLHFAISEPIAIQNGGGASLELLINIDSANKVLMAYVAEIFAFHKGAQVTRVLMDMEQMIDALSLKKLDQLKGKS